jgi:hypothetical protein
MSEWKMNIIKVVLDFFNKKTEQSFLVGKNKLVPKAVGTV